MLLPFRERCRRHDATTEDGEHPQPKQHAPPDGVVGVGDQRDAELLLQALQRLPKVRVPADMSWPAPEALAVHEANRGRLASSDLELLSEQAVRITAGHEHAEVLVVTDRIEVRLLAVTVHNLPVFTDPPLPEVHREVHAAVDVDEDRLQAVLCEWHPQNVYHRRANLPHRDHHQQPDSQHQPAEQLAGFPIEPQHLPRDHPEVVPKLAQEAQYD